MMRLLLLLVVGLALVSAQTAGSSCGMRVLRQQLNAVDDACCAAGECGDSEPVPATCSAACAAVYVPFWNLCGAMLSSEGDPEAAAYATFSLSCLAAISPPGSCGDGCDASSFQCRSNEVRLACCDEDHDCIDSHMLSGAAMGSAGAFSPPTGCGYECSLVLPGFWAACRPFMHEAKRDVYNADAMGQFSSAAAACENQDPSDLLNMLYEKKYVNGCLLHTTGLSHGGGGSGHNGGPDAFSALRIRVA